MPLSHSNLSSPSTHLSRSPHCFSWQPAAPASLSTLSHYNLSSSGKEKEKKNLRRQWKPLPTIVKEKELLWYRVGFSCRPQLTSPAAPTAFRGSLLLLLECTLSHSNFSSLNSPLPQPPLLFVAACCSCFTVHSLTLQFVVLKKRKRKEKLRRQWKPLPTLIKEKEPLWYRVGLVVVLNSPLLQPPLLSVAACCPAWLSTLSHSNLSSLNSPPLEPLLPNTSVGLARTINM